MAFLKTDVVKISCHVFFCFRSGVFFSPKILEVAILQVLSSNLDPIEAEMWRGEMGETAKLNLSPLKSYDRKGRSLPLKHHFAGTVKLWGVCIES